MKISIVKCCLLWWDILKNILKYFSFGICPLALLDSEKQACEGLKIKVAAADFR